MSEPRPAPVYVVTLSHWRYNNLWYEGENKPLMAFRDRRAAEAQRDRLQKEAAADLDHAARAGGQSPHDESDWTYEVVELRLPSPDEAGPEAAGDWDTWLHFLASSDRDERTEAAEFLYAHPVADPAVVAGLARALSDGYARVRWRAAAALGAIGPAAAVASPALQAALHDYVDYVRVRAAHALARVDPAADRTLPDLPPGYEMFRLELELDLQDDPP